jgi:hypothetical protein
MLSGHLEYFATIVYILWAFGNFVVVWYIFPPLWYIVPRKIWQPCTRVGRKDQLLLLVV